MSVPLTSHPRASLDSPPLFVPFVPPTVATAASVKWASAGCVGGQRGGCAGTCIFKPRLWPASEVNRDGAGGVVSSGHCGLSVRGLGGITGIGRYPAGKWGLFPVRERLSTGWGLCPLEPGSPRQPEQSPWEQGARSEAWKDEPGRAGEEGWAAGCG